MEESEWSEASALPVYTWRGGNALLLREALLAGAAAASRERVDSLAGSAPLLADAVGGVTGGGTLLLAPGLRESLAAGELVGDEEGEPM